MVVAEFALISTIGNFVGDLFLGVTSNVIAANLQGRLDSLAHRKFTNHDIDAALFRAWQISVELIFNQYRESPDYKKMSPDNQAGLKDIETEWRDRETFNTIFLSGLQVDLLGGSQDVRDWFVRDIKEVNRQVMERLNGLMLLDVLPKGLRRRVEDATLTSTVIYNFIEIGIKRDDHSRDAVFYNLLIQLNQDMGKLKGQEVELCNRVRDGMMTHPDLRPWMDRVSNEIFGLSKVVSELQLEIQQMREDIRQLRLAGEEVQADNLAARLEQMMRQVTSDAMKENMKLLMDAVMERFAALLARQPEAPVDLATRLRVFLHGAVSRFHHETQPWMEDAVPLETVYIQLNAMQKQADAASRVLVIDQLFTTQRCVLLLGEAGAGKTTALRAFGMRLAKECRVGSGGVASGQIPIYIPLGEYEELERRKPGTTPNRLLAFILRYFPVLPRDSQEALLESGQVALLLDGLDEVAGSLQGQVVKEIQDFSTSHLGQSCRIIVTSRSASYQKGQDRLADPFQLWTLASIDVAEQKALAQRWLIAMSGPTQGEALYAELLNEMAHRPAITHAMRSPLLITMLLAVYVATRKIGSPSQRYEHLVNILLLRSKGIRAASTANLEPSIEREISEAKALLGWLAFRSLETGRRLGRADVMQELARSGLSADEAYNFLRRMETQAGLIKMLAGPGEDTLTFTPHATFQDFFAGYHLRLESKKNPASVRKFIEKQVSSAAWEASVGFLLDLIKLDTAWPALMHILEHEPLIAARLLKNGMELTYEELSLQQRDMIFKRLQQRAWELLSPIPGVPLLKLRLLTPNGERHYLSALRKRQEAIEAAGEIRVSAFGPLMVRAALQVPWLMYEFTGAMIKMGPRELWPQLEDWLNVKEDNFHYWAHQVIIQWEGPEARKVFHLILEHSEWKRIALEAFARRKDAESQAMFQQALKDPDLVREALAIGLEYNCPGLAEAGLDWLKQNPGETYIFGRKLVAYLAQRPVLEAADAIRRILAADLGFEKIRDLFESADENVLVPLLAIFTEIFKDADEKLQNILNSAIGQAIKGCHIDSHYGDAAVVLEQALLYCNQSVRQMLCRQFSPRALGDAACIELLKRIDVSAPYPAWVESVEILEAIPPVASPWREQIIEKLRPGLENEEKRYYISILMARLGAQDESVTGYLLGLALPADLDRSSGDYHAIEALVSQCGPAAFPLVVQGLSGWRGLDSQKAAAVLGRMWPELTTAQKDKASGLLRKHLQSKDWFTRMQVVDVLGLINSQSDADAILDMVAEGSFDPEEPLCGRALGRMGLNTFLEQALWENFQQGNEHMCRTVVHAWRMCGEARAGRYLVRAIGSSKIRLASDSSTAKTEMANDYLRGQAVCELGWLAADLARRCYKMNLMDGWASIARELGTEGVKSLAQKALSNALAFDRPGQSLFDQARQSRGAQAEMMMYLCAAYEWSEVILALLISEDADAPAVWVKLQEFFNKKNSPERLAEMQTGLVVRLNWNKPGLPFENLARLHRQVDYGFQRMVYDFSDYARHWWNWLDWQRERLY